MTYREIILEAHKHVDQLKKMVMEFCQRVESYAAEIDRRSQEAAERYRQQDERRKPRIPGKIEKAKKKELFYQRRCIEISDTIEEFEAENRGPDVIEALKKEYDKALRYKDAYRRLTDPDEYSAVSIAQRSRRRLPQGQVWVKRSDDTRIPAYAYVEAPWRGPFLRPITLVNPTCWFDHVGYSGHISLKDEEKLLPDAVFVSVAHDFSSSIPKREPAVLWNVQDHAEQGPFYPDPNSPVLHDGKYFRYRKFGEDLWEEIREPTEAEAKREEIEESRKKNEAKLTLAWQRIAEHLKLAASHPAKAERPSKTARGGTKNVEVMDRTVDRQLDLDTFVRSASDETLTKTFVEWAGAERVTLTIVFTDVVDSTALGNKIGDECMSNVRNAHFEQGRKLISVHKGREVKTIGDSIMAAFHSVDQGLDFAVAFQSDPGHPQIRIRAGIHAGAMQVEGSDVFGGTVNFAARVVSAIRGTEIWLSEQAKAEIDGLRASRHSHLRWERHDGIAMKGFSGTFTLWSLAASTATSLCEADQIAASETWDGQAQTPNPLAQPGERPRTKDSGSDAKTVNIQNSTVIIGDKNVVGDQSFVGKETPTGKRNEKDPKKTVAAITAFLAQLWTCSGWLKPIKAFFHWLGF